MSLALWRSLSRLAFRTIRPLLAHRRMMIVALFFVPAEDHLSGGRLKHAGDRRFDSLADHLAGVVHHNHRSVIEVRDALIEFLAFLQNENLHGLTRQIDRLESVREFVDIQHLNTAKLRDLVQIEVVGHDLRVELLGEFDQLHVHFANLWIVIFNKLDGDSSHLLNSLQNVEPSPAAITLQRIGGVSHLLQFAQDKVRNYKNSVKKAGFANVGDTAVDDHASIENFVGLLGRSFAPEYSSKCGQVQEIAFLGTNN